MNIKSLVRIKHVVFWEPCVSPHKADLFAGLKKVRPDLNITCLAQQDLPPERAAMGWSVGKPDGYDQVINPSGDEIDKFVSDNIDSTVHIFSGYRHVPMLVAGLRQVRKRNACFGIMSEPRVRHGWKGLLRFAQSWLTEGWLRANASFVLAIGRNGPPWFRSVGFDESKIFPFAYFVDQTKPQASRRESPPPFRIGYLGRLVEMKGVSDLIAAIGMSVLPLHLKVAGNGNDRDHLEALCRRKNLVADFVGPIAITAVPDFLSDLDILVLPSRSMDDGWGVVVSEALLSGIAVVATNYVGASVLLNDIRLGLCVSPRSPKDISSAIEKICASDALSEEMRNFRKLYAKEKLTGRAGALYLSTILESLLKGYDQNQPFYQ